MKKAPSTDTVVPAPDTARSDAAPVPHLKTIGASYAIEHGDFVLVDAAPVEGSDA